jgi:hypothetical protein
MESRPISLSCLKVAVHNGLSLAPLSLSIAKGRVILSAIQRYNVSAPDSRAHTAMLKWTAGCSARASLFRVTGLVLLLLGVL